MESVYGAGKSAWEGLLKALNDSLPKIKGKPKAAVHKLESQLAAKSASQRASVAKPKASAKAAKLKPGPVTPPRLSLRSTETSRTLENERAVWQRSTPPVMLERSAPSLTAAAQVNHPPRPIPALPLSLKPPVFRTEVRVPELPLHRTRSQDDPVTAVTSMMGLVTLMGCITSAGLAATLALSEDSR